MKRQMFKMIPILAISVSIGAYAADEQQDQPRFTSPTEAGEHLFQAVQQNDEQAIAKILG